MFLSGWALTTCDHKAPRSGSLASKATMSGRSQNNIAENSHQPTRQRERKIQQFKSPGSARRFLATHTAVHNTVNVKRHLLSAQTHRALRAAAMTTWRTAVAAA